jgi:hypothetical protein
MSHFLVALLLEGLLCIRGLKIGCSYGVTILVVPATFFGVLSQMGAALVLAMLAEPCGRGLFWDSCNSLRFPDTEHF